MNIRECKHHGATDHAYSKKTKSHRCRKCQSVAVQKRRVRVKEMSIDYLGGKCKKCGYNQCRGALEFHHRDPSKKEFGIAAAGYTRSWEKVKKELDKCDLLCANCHREIHHKEWDFVFRTTIENKICPICKKEYKPTRSIQKNCSIKCSAMSQRKIDRPTKEVLEVEIAENNWSELARKYNVSHTTVRKWAKSYNLL